MIVAHTAIAILAVVVLIVVVKVDPVISLVAGALYLGLTGGLGFEGTATALVDGFGSIMGEVGLLIGFGVLIGSLLLTMGALQRLVGGLLHRLGPRRLPYAMAAVMTVLFPSIYVDVQLVLAAPLARQAAPRLGPVGLGVLGAALSTGILVGYVFVVPGLGTISVAALLGVPLASVLGYGLVIAAPTALLTVFLFSRLARAGLWRPATDEIDLSGRPVADRSEPTGDDTTGSPVPDGRSEDTASGPARSTGDPGSGSAAVEQDTISAAARLPLVVVAIGSIAVAGLTAAGIIGPIVGQLGLPAVIIGLAIGAGSLFALQVNSNFFWMFQSLLGVSTRGALKALTLVTAMASLIALPLVIGLALVI